MMPLSPQERALIATDIAALFNTSIPVYENRATTDGYGHPAPDNWMFKGNEMCLVKQPTASQLTAYADIIGSLQAIILQFSPTGIIEEGNRVIYDNAPWLVQDRPNSSSYSFSDTAVATRIA